MSPILDLQRREVERGRVRFGNKRLNDKGKEVPNRLDHPLITSPDKEIVDAIAAAHGKTAVPWPGDPENQWQVEVDELKILVPVSPEPISAWWERWSGGGCMRRCDGFIDTINDAPCDCDKDAEKRACSATTRINVLTPWTGDARLRIESKSINAAVELPGALERTVGEKTGEVIPGILRVEQRRGKKGTVPVPVIVLDKVSGGASNPDGGGSQPPTATKGPEDPTAAPKAQESSVDAEAGGPSAPEDSTRSTDLILPSQIAQIMIEARAAGLKEAEVKAIVLQVAGVRSRKEVTAEKFPQVIAAIKGEMVPEVQEVRHDL